MRDLGWLIAPLSVDAFFSQYWTTKSKRWIRQTSSYYESLLSEDSLEQAVYAAAKAGGLEDLWDGDRPRPIRGGPRAAFAAFRGGHSLRVDGAQRFVRDLAVFCRRLEQEISCLVNINLYITPGASRALSRHFDTHDVFVLQAFGRKRWRLYDEPVSMPLEYLPAVRGERQDRMRAARAKKSLHLSGVTPDKVIEEFTLEPGDCLYLPRGHWHEAEGTPSQVSCHLTVGLQTLTYTDLLTVALTQAALECPDLRAELPVGFGTHSNRRAEVQTRANKILEVLPTLFVADRALDELTEIYQHGRQPVEGGLLRVRDETRPLVGLDSALVLKDGIVCRVRSTESEVEISSDDVRVSLPLAFEAALRSVALGSVFVPADLPGAITDEERVSLGQRLLEDGLLALDRQRDVGLTHDMNPRWLPIELKRDAHPLVLTWADFSSTSLSDPLFSQSVARLSAGARVRRKVTGFAELLNQPKTSHPGALIFHMSRCGSTLLANAIRAFQGVEVASEPEILSDILRLPTKLGDAESISEQLRLDLLRGAVAAFCSPRSNDESVGRLVIKFSSWNILFLAKIRALWADIPVVTVIREPAEVIVSCLERPTGWLRMKAYGNAGHLFGWTAEEVRGMEKAEYCARVLGRFLEAANEVAAWSGTLVVTYEELMIPGRVVDIAADLGCDATRLDQAQLDQELKLYSKDKDKLRRFEDDRDRKQAAVTETIRAAADRWATPAYRALLARSRHSGEPLTTA